MENIWLCYNQHASRNGANGGAGILWPVSSTPPLNPNKQDVGFFEALARILSSSLLNFVKFTILYTISPGAVLLISEFMKSKLAPPFPNSHIKQKKHTCPLACAFLPSFHSSFLCFIQFHDVFSIFLIFRLCGIVFTSR